MRRRPWSVRSRGCCSACGSAGGLGDTKDEDCGHILTTQLNATLTVIDTSQLATDTTRRPNGLSKNYLEGFQPTSEPVTTALTIRSATSDAIFPTPAAPRDLDRRQSVPN